MNEDGAMEELKALVRVGIISKVDAGKMTARVKYVQQGTMSGDMKLLQNHPDNCTAEYKCPSCGKCKWIPKPGQYVLCVLIPGGDGDGVILGGI